MEKAEQAQAVADMSPQDKAARDAKLWKAWLKKYVHRLQQERGLGTTAEERLAIMKASNPVIVLRNWVAQAAVESAEAGDFSVVRISASVFKIK